MKAEASKLKPVLSIPVSEDNLTGLRAFVPNSRVPIPDVTPFNPVSRLNNSFFNASASHFSRSLGAFSFFFFFFFQILHRDGNIKVL